MWKKIIQTSGILFAIIIGLMVTVFVVNAGRVEEDQIDSQIKNQIESLKSDLSTIVDSDQQTSIQAKINALQYQADMQQTARMNAPQKPTNICAAMPQNSISEKQRPIGILPGGTGPFSSQVLQVENQWQDQINSYWMHLYAGVSGLDNDQGAVILWIEDVESGGFFADPEPEGALTIIASHGPRIELLTSLGNVRYFDILAQQFIPDLDYETKAIELPAPVTFDPCQQIQETSND